MPKSMAGQNARMTPERSMKFTERKAAPGMIIIFAQGF
jgi:hypothetical protein